MSLKSLNIVQITEQRSADTKGVKKKLAEIALDDAIERNSVIGKDVADRVKLRPRPKRRMTFFQFL